MPATTGDRFRFSLNPSYNAKRLARPDAFSPEEERFNMANV
jgi:hypothetical protein